MSAHQLTIEPLGDTIEVEEGQTILDACLRAGVYLPHACGHGLCGTCKTQVTDGEIDHGAASNFALMDFEREDGFVLACTATLVSDVTIEADIEEDPDARRINVRDFAGTVVGLEDLTHDVKGVLIALEDGPIDFQAGQYINVVLPGVEGSRAFSIANAPSDGMHVELQIRRVPGGAGTGYIHEQLKLGERLDAQRPLRALPRAQVARRPPAVSRRRHRRLQPALDDPRPARRGLCGADHSGARRARAGRSLRARGVRGAGAGPIRISATSRRCRRSRRRAIGRASAASSTTSPSASMAACSPATPLICAGRR